MEVGLASRGLEVRRRFGVQGSRRIAKTVAVWGAPPPDPPLLPVFRALGSLYPPEGVPAHTVSSFPG